MNKYLLLLLVCLIACQEVRSIDPVTGLVIAGTVVAGMWRTATGKVLFGYALAKAAQTPPGKYLVARAEQRALQVVKQKRALMVARWNARWLAVQARMGFVAPGLWAAWRSRDFGNMNQAGHNPEQQASGVHQSSEFGQILEKLRQARKNGNGLTADVHVVQQHVGQGPTVNQLFVFVYNRQRWKDLLLGALGGAALTVYAYKKSDEDEYNRYLQLALEQEDR